MKRATQIMLGAALVSAALLPAEPVDAQQVSYAISDRSAAVDPTVLEAQASKLYDSPKTFRRAAKLHIEAAEMRDAADPMRVTNRTVAAQLYYYLGDLDRARTLLEQAADDAIAAGDVVKAAGLYLDAASVAQDEKDGENVLRLVAKARLLMASPLVDARERDRILSRIDDRTIGTA